MSAVSVHRLPETKTPDVRAGAIKQTKRILVVTSHFPPWRDSAVYRMVGLTRSLPQLGWQTTVLTIQPGSGTQEPQLLEKLPTDIRIVRTRYLRASGWESTAANAVRRTGAFRTGPGDSRQTWFDRCLRLGGRFLRSSLYFPDDMNGWIPFAVARAIQLHSKQKFDMVFTTSPPRTTPIIGLLLKRLCGLPWVSEFMDPWYPAEGRLRRMADDRLQRLLMRKADRIVVMVPEHAQDLERMFGLPSEKLAVVRNGFFEEDFTSLDAIRDSSLKPDFINFAHFGTIYPGNEGNFFPALKDLMSKRPSLRDRVRVHIVGAASEEVLREVEQDGLKGIIQVHGFIPNRADILRMMRSSHCLLLFWGRPDFSRLAVAGKTYDYLRAGRPILAVTSEGGVKQLVEGAEAGWTVPPNDVEAIKRALLEVIENATEAEMTCPPKPEFVAQFRWDRQAEILAQTLREALGHGS